MSLITSKPGEGPFAQAARRCGQGVVAAFKRLGRPFDWRRAFPWIDNPRPVAIGAGVVIVALLIGMALIDGPATRAVPYLPHGLISFFDYVTDYGKSAWFLWPLGLTFLALAALPRILTRISQAVLAAVMVRVGFLFAAIGLPSLLASLVKNMIGRARPGVPGTIDPFVFEPFHWAPAYASLPSGHATTAFAALAAIGTLFPRARTAMLVFAIMIAISRVALKAHFVTDVLAGAVFGIVGAILVRRWFAAVRLGFGIGQDGQLRQFPGPSARRIKAVARELLA